MNPVHSLGEVYALVQSVKSKCNTLLTNLFIDTEKTKIWIAEEKMLWFDGGKNGILLLRKDNDFDYIYYITENIHSLYLLLTGGSFILAKGTCVVDIVGRLADVNQIAAVFGKLGFFRHDMLQRYTKTNKAGSNDYGLNSEVELAIPEDCKTISEMLQNNFDPFTDQINNEKEVEALIRAGKVIKIADNVTVRGFLIRTILPQMSVLNNFLVNPLFRGEKIGSKLLKHYIFETKYIKRLLLWVRTDNENAIDIYERHGYQADCLFDLIMINNVLYEKN